MLLFEMPYKAQTDGGGVLTMISMDGLLDGFDNQIRDTSILNSKIAYLPEVLAAWPTPPL